MHTYIKFIICAIRSFPQIQSQIINNNNNNNIVNKKTVLLQFMLKVVNVLPGAQEPRSVQLRATALDFEWFRHLPYMDISSSGESPFVVAARKCEISATYCVSTRTERILLFRARDANSRIVN